MTLVSPLEAPAGVSDAIRKASEVTGTDFDYLLTTAARESNFQARARAETSSAAGLFQFIESTWLQTVKEEGDRFGLDKYGPHIQRTESGNYTVPNPELREEILGLRHDPEVAATMAGAFTQQNEEYVSERLGREPSEGELYIAHFLGANGATRLITLASQDPSARADAHFPKAAAANRGIFYSDGQARSAAQVYELLVSDHSRLGAMTRAAASQASQTQSWPDDATSALRSGPEPRPAAFAGARDSARVSDAAAGRAGGDEPSGLIRRTRVAALTDSSFALGAGTGTANDAGSGSIGAWRTIVKRAGEAAPAPDGASARTASVAGDTARSGGQRSGDGNAQAPSGIPRQERPDAPAPMPERRPFIERDSAPAPETLGVFERDYWNNLNLDGA